MPVSVRGPRGRRDAEWFEGAPGAQFCRNMGNQNQLRWRLFLLIWGVATVPLVVFCASGALSAVMAAGGILGCGVLAFVAATSGASSVSVGLAQSA